MKRFAACLTTCACFLACKAPRPSSSAAIDLGPAQRATQPAPASLSVARELAAPRAKSAIHADGELNEIAWHDAASSGPFIDLQSHEAARPFSEARVLHDDKTLYLVLYAADEDIRVPPRKQRDGDLGAFDHFVVRIQAAKSDIYQLQIGADGSEVDEHVTAAAKSSPSWASHAVIGIDRDGTVNDPTDEDEEWVVEAALPLASFDLIDGDAFFLSVSRCDTLKDKRRICGAWGGGPEGAPHAKVRLAP